jgi:hypothetical protein
MVYLFSNLSRYSDGLRVGGPGSLPDRLWGPTSHLSNGYTGTFPGEGVKCLEREADKSPISSAEIKNGGTIPNSLLLA